MELVALKRKFEKKKKKIEISQPPLSVSSCASKRMKFQAVLVDIKLLKGAIGIGAI